MCFIEEVISQIGAIDARGGERLKLKRNVLISLVLFSVKVFAYFHVWDLIAMNCKNCKCILPSKMDVFFNVAIAMLVRAFTCCSIAHFLIFVAF